MNKRWNILTADSEKTGHLEAVLKVNKTACKILVQRQIDDFDKCKTYFRPQLSDLHDPFLMKDMDKAVTRVTDAFLKKEKVLVFGDYDVDGTASVALMYQFLCDIYDDSLVEFYIPHRYREGYGVSKMGIDYANANGFSLIISLDCGIKSTALIAYAKELGIDFIVCDHHLPDKETPVAAAILNAKQTDCNYPYKELCGCGVGFKFITALGQTFDLPEEKYFCYLDLVATAIAADIVPITGENRVLAYYGLEKINSNPSPGIKALIHLAGLQKKLTISNVVFVIAPRVNAAGRMDDAKKAVQLFVEKDPVKAMEFAEILHSDNSDRKDADSTITAEALAVIEGDEVLIKKKTTVVYKEHWHKGVVGIVASRLIETYYRPTIVLTKSGGVATGSARSISGFNLYEAIHACKEHLLAYGGHFAAAGLSLLPENIPAFSQQFDDFVEANINADLLIPEIIIDAEISFEEITKSLYKIITQMEPFGPGNMRPVFVARNVADNGFSKIVKENHVRFVLKQNKFTLTGIGFNMADKFSLLENNKPVDIVFSIDENEWNDTVSLQLRIIDLIPSTEKKEEF